METAYDVEGYLVRKGVHVKHRQGDEVNVPCWYHDEDPGKRGRLYVNVGNNPEYAGLHMCHVCGHKGNLITLMKWFGDTPPQAEQDDVNPYVRTQIYAVATEYYASNLDLDHFKWLQQERGLTPATIKNHQLGWADGGLYKHLKDKGFDVDDMVKTGLVVRKTESQAVQPDGTFVLDTPNKEVIYDFLRDCITIPYHLTGNPVLIRGKKIGGKYLTPPNQDSRLFNSDATWGTDQVIVTEGEFDALIVEQMGYRAVGLAGANTWQQHYNSYMDQAKRVYIVFDNDKAGAEGAAKVKEELGRKARIIQMPDGGLPPGENDISEHFGKQGHSVEEFEELLRSVRSGILVSVHEAFEEWENLQGVGGLKFGYERLDFLLEPGLLPGQVCVPLAKTNTGKTIHILNTFHRMKMAKPDVKILFCSLEQTPADWFERARRIYAFYNMTAELKDVNALALKYWQDNLYMTGVNRMSEEDLLAAVDDFEMENGRKPDMVAIDYLGYWAQSFKPSSRYEKLTEAVMALKAIAKETRIPIFSPHQVSRGADFGSEPDLSDARDSGAVEETADFVFGMWNEDTRKGVDPEDKKGEVNLRILKSRHGGKGHKITMQFGYCTLVMAPHEDPAATTFARDELVYAARGESWQDAMTRHKTGIKDGPLLSFGS